MRKALEHVYSTICFGKWILFMESRHLGQNPNPFWFKSGPSGGVPAWILFTCRKLKPRLAAVDCGEEVVGRLALGMTVSLRCSLARMERVEKQLCELQAYGGQVLSLNACDASHRDTDEI